MDYFTPIHTPFIQAIKVSTSILGPEIFGDTGIFNGIFRDPPIMGPPSGKRDPYHSHILRDSYGNSMGSLP